MKLDLYYLFTAKYARWIIGVLWVIFCALIIAEFANFIFFPLVKTNLVSEDIKIAVQPKQDSAQFILQSSLFGIYIPNGLNEHNVKKSMLNVIVVGVMFADKPEDSQAIIRSDGGEEKTYKVGDMIPGGVKIERITVNGILIERKGNLESLSLPKNDLLFEPVLKPLEEEE